LFGNSEHPAAEMRSALAINIKRYREHHVVMAYASGQNQCVEWLRG
jgi:hypothetical protein